jgi:methylthioribose-1-phosphate isomerase
VSATAAPTGLAPADIIALEDGCVRLLDQTRLPAEIVTRRCATWPEVVDAIATLAVRGAPAIGIAGAMGVALAARTGPDDLGALRVEIRTAGAGLRAARPTAVNLMWAVDRVLAIADAHPGPRDALVARLADEARSIHADEVRRCKQMGAHALPLLHRGARILTHCNAGALATGGYGTALGVVRAAYAADPTVQVLVDETRPLLQGSRLTAWELHQERIPYTLIADNMAATMMAEGRVTHVVVGADRIAANGDVVNKIGTYGVAVLAREHDIPFIVAAPTTTFDLTLPSAAQIPIEERSSDEITGIDLFGRATTPPEATVANPAFDRTPQHLVSAIVTEVGLHRPPYDRTLREALAAAGHGPVGQTK